MPKFILGSHSLSQVFEINDPRVLRGMMQTTHNRGGRLFEIPYLLCRLAWSQVGQIAKRAGIEEISLCHFWPMGDDGNSLCGDPLGERAEVDRAITTFDGILKVVGILRDQDVRVRFIDGPTWGGLGKSYDYSENVRRGHVVQFLTTVAGMCEKHGVVLAVEFLRPEEDKVVGGTPAMLQLLREVNSPAIRMHFDVFHSLCRGENPAEMIRLAGNQIAYLHLHGTDRRAPGSRGDRCNWVEIIKATDEISSGVDPIPVVPEPFGKLTRQANRTLGQGLPRTPCLGRYLDQAYATFRRCGLKDSVS